MSAVYEKYKAKKSLFRKRALENNYNINHQFLIELTGFENLFELIDQMNVSWFKSASKTSRDAALDLALLLDSTRSSKIFEAAIIANPNFLANEHKQKAKEILIGFGEIKKANNLGLSGLQQLDAENPFRNQFSSLETKISWLRNFLDLSKHHKLDFTEDRFMHPVDSFEISNDNNQVSQEITSVVVIARSPTEELNRTIKSVLSSGLSPLEVLVMQQLDTAKGFRTPIDVQRFSPNVKTILVPETLKLHQILNRALDESSGKYLCLLSQGEILHPDALSVMKSKARKKAIVTANKSHIGFGFELTNSSSIIGLINKPLAKNFGYFDHVRIGSLDGFLERLGPRKHLERIFCFSTIQKPEEELVKDASRHYLALQRSFVSSNSRPFVSNSPIRSFYAPRPVRFGFKLSVNRRELNTVFALDMSNPQSLARLLSSINEGQLTGIWDINPWWSEQELVIPDQLRELMDKRIVQFVYPEERISIDRLLVIDSEALEAVNPKRQPRWDVVDFEFDDTYRKTIKNLFPVSEI